MAAHPRRPVRRDHICCSPVQVCYPPSHHSSPTPFLHSSLYPIPLTSLLRIFHPPHPLLMSTQYATCFWDTQTKHDTTKEPIQSTTTISDLRANILSKYNISVAISLIPFKPSDTPPQPGAGLTYVCGEGQV